jgi:hypothetical protein
LLSISVEIAGDPKNTEAKTGRYVPANSQTKLNSFLRSPVFRPLDEKRRKFGKLDDYEKYLTER